MGAVIQGIEDRFEPIRPGTLRRTLDFYGLPHTTPHILYIAEAPGKAEDVSGQLMYGPSGRILRLIQEHAKTTHIFTLTNTICCLPLNNFGKIRTPDPDEMESCRPHIDNLIESFNFHSCITFGKIAADLELPIATTNLIHPAAIVRQDFPLYDIKRSALRMKRWVETPRRDYVPD